MTEPSPARPIAGPPSPGPSPRPSGAAAAEPAMQAAGPEGERASFDELAELPVAEHVAVFEAEHARLQRELSTIDQL